MHSVVHGDKELCVSAEDDGLHPRPRVCVCVCVWERSPLPCMYAYLE